MKHWLAFLLDEQRRKRRELAAFLGLPPPRITEMIKGRRQISFAEAASIARFFDLGIECISALAGLSSGEQEDVRQFEIVGYVGAGAQVFPIEDQEGSKFERAEVPAGVDPAKNTMLIVRGDSMYPIKDGYIICYAKHHDRVSGDCIGELCVCQTIGQDGLPCAVYVKEVRRGTIPERFTLYSWNADPIENVRLMWAARVTSIIIP